MQKRSVVLLGCLAACLAGCATPNYNAEALRVAAEAPPSSDFRSFESRRFYGVSDTKLLASIAACMQDLGFTVTETSAEAGVVTAAKTRSAVETRQVIGGLLMALALGANSPGATFDKTQEIHVTVVTAPAGYVGAHEVRVSFDRFLTNNRNEIDRTETVTDPKIYAEFFSKLENAIRLEQRS